MAFWAILFFALIFHSPAILGMLDCDPAFARQLDSALSSTVPENVPNRQAFMESVKMEILGVYRTSFKNIKYLRIIGEEMFMKNIKNLKEEIILQMKQSLEKFADIACSEDCSVIEGPLLDSKTCLRVRAQCFKGSVCGEQDDLEAEKKQVFLFLSVILEIVIMFTIMILCYHYYKMKTTQVKEKILKLMWSKKAQDIEEGSRNI
ncbi:izumo sperm-egg fusion protein 3 isoform 2-T2 [Anomaloglossus baeobatrachus]